MEIREVIMDHLTNLFADIERIVKVMIIITGLILVMLLPIQAGKAEAKEEKTMIIDGVERLQWGKGMESTYMGALTVAMKAMGEDVTYDYLMGVSGAAFRLHIHQRSESYGD